MTGQIVLVTGSTDGIGKETVLQLARMGAHLILHGRDRAKAEKVLEQIRSATGAAEPDLVVADLLSLQQVREMGSTLRSRYDRLNVLVNNAGVYMTERSLSKDGLETTFAVNYLAPFLLTHLILDLLKAGAPSRIINVSSVAHERARVDFDNLQGEKRYSGYGAYAFSKFGNLVFTVELAQRLAGTGVTVNAMHPGVVATNLLQKGFPNLSGTSWTEGAQTVVYLASAPEVAGVTGKYFVRKKEQQPSPLVADASVRQKLWTISESLAGVR